MRSRSVDGLSFAGAWLAVLAVLACGSGAAAQPAASAGQVVGIAFVGRLVRDLDRSIEFYQAIGFSQDPAADSSWRRNEVIEHLYGIRNVRTRMAKMFVQNLATGQRFVVYLRELKGIERRDLS